MWRRHSSTRARRRRAVRALHAAGRRPAVRQQLKLEYHFPAYTGLEPQKIEDGGDIAVLRGTDVQRADHADDEDARAGGCMVNDKRRSI